MENNNKEVDIEIKPEVTEVLNAVFDKKELPFFMEARLLVEEAINLESGQEMPDSAMRIIDTMLGLYDENLALSQRVDQLERQLEESKKNVVFH